MATKKTAPAAGRATKATKAAPAHNGGEKQARAPRRKAAVERIPEEVTVDFHGVRETLAKSTESAKKAEQEARGARQEAGELRERIEAAARQVEEKANGAIVRINRARDQAEEAAKLHREAEEKARQATREAERALHTAREMTQKLRGLEVEHQEAWEKAVAELAEDIQLVRQPGGKKGRTAGGRLEAAPARPAEAAAAPPAPDEPPVTPGAVELVPEEASEEGGKVVKANVRSETPNEHLSRVLQQLLAVKASVIDALRDASDDSFDPAVARPLAEQRRVTEEQSKEMEARLRELGGEPPAGRGAFRRLLAWAWEGWGREPDDLYRTVQGVWKAMAGQSLEMAMCQTLAPLARGMGDPETARLAERHWRQKEAAINELRPYLVPMAELTARMGEVAFVARQPLRVEADIAHEPEANGRAEPDGGEKRD